MKIAVLYNLVDKDDPFAESENEVLDSVTAIKESLKPDHNVFPVQVTWDIFDTMEKFDVVFNLAEGIGNDSSAEPLIPNKIKVPYTGSDFRVLGLCNDKDAVKRFLKERKINVPEFQVFVAYPDGDLDIRFPVIVKPVREHGSLGISSDSVVFNKNDLARKVEKIINTFKEPAICEEYIDGREISASIIGNGDKARVISLSEISFDLSEDLPKILPYEAKWSIKSDYYKKTKAVCPANIEKNLKNEIEILALSVYKLIGIRDYGRIDFRVRDDEVFVIDVNPNPCINPADSGFSMALKSAGISFKEFVRMLFSFALERGDITLRLRPVCECDIPLLVEWFNDKEGTKYMEDPVDFYTDEYLKERINRESYDFITLLGDKPIGFCSIYNIRDGTGEISVLIGDKEYRRKGYGDEMLKELCSYGFSMLNLKELFAWIDERNVTSLKAFQSAGFNEIMRADGYIFLKRKNLP